MQPVVSFISLGCPKNTVDSERLLAEFVQDGFLLAEAPDDADVCIVNTCGFIENAREEVREVLEELAETKRAGSENCPLIVAVGCLVEHAEKNGLQEYLDKADLCIGFGDYMELPQRCRRALGKGADDWGGNTATALPQAFSEQPRLLTGREHTSYLKISEGCSNACSFCAIPGIRGYQVSRSVEAVVAEAKQLMESGVREINIIAQDSSAYGLDLYGRRELSVLLRDLAVCEWNGWFRLMYVSPVNLMHEMLEVIAGDTRFCPYVDMPLQHISNEILASMNRRVSGDEVRRLLDQVRDAITDVALRTAFIVGYPGETDEHFQQLYDFVREQQFDHMGVFTYSCEPGTAAADLADTVPASVKQTRMETLMELQQDISRKRLADKMGQQMEVMIDGVQLIHFEEGEQACLTGHTQRQAIDIDGCVIIDDCGQAYLPGEIIPVRVMGNTDYDLIGDPLV